jgi:phage shock protein E
MRNFERHSGKGNPMRRILIVAVLTLVTCLAAANSLDQATLKDYLANGAPFDFILIDVRSSEEASTVIGNAACKPYNLAWPDQFKNEIVRIPKDQSVIVYCRSGNRSRNAAAFLSSEGYTRVYDAGGILTWDGPTIPGSEIKPASLLPEPSMRANEARNPELFHIPPALRVEYSFVPECCEGRAFFPLPLFLSLGF